MSKRKRKTKYLRYLKSGHWGSLRQAAFERDGWKCVTCGSPHGLQEHHKTYRKDLLKCTVKDIETLCVTCHKKHHRVKRDERRAKRKERNRMDPMVWLLCHFDAR